VLDHHDKPLAEQTVGTSVTSSEAISSEAVKSPDRVESTLQPRATLAPVARSNEIRVPEVPRKEQPCIPGNESEQPSPHSSIHTATIQEAPVAVRLHPAPTIPDAAAGTVTNQIKTQDAGDAKSQVTIRQRSDSPQSDEAKLSTIEPVRQQQLEVARPTHPTAALPQDATREPARETHNIQVKIGKVEIRSTQPALVVQAPRRTSASGFEDLKMARNYFNRAQG
jgi:hypothetical protein